MKGRLIKTGKLYALEVDDIIATTDNYLSTKLEHLYRLSLKNCEAIENGYDLDELVIDEIPDSSSTTLQVQRMRFIHGFQKALEILSDKKFSEDDVLKIVTHVLNELVLVDGFDKQYLFPESIYQETTTKCKSLQQTEWEVEVVYHRACNADNFNCGNEDKCQICTKVCPKLDENGCLILKRI